MVWGIGAHTPGGGMSAQGRPDSASAPVLEVFVREGCPHCSRAKEWLPELQARHPALQLRIADVLEDPAALARLLRYAGADSATVGVPAFHARDRLIIGWRDASTTGREIEQLLFGDTPTPRDMSAVPSADMSEGPRTSPDTLDVPVLGRISVARLGLPMFSVVLGLVDGFNPCAMWVLVFVLSILVGLKDRRRVLWVGGTFVLASGVVYFAFMAAWLNVFLLVGVTRPLQVILGLVALAAALVNIKDFFAFGRGPSLSIPDSAKPGLYAQVRRVVRAEHLAAALGSAVILAVLVNTVELLCTSGLPAVFTQVLASRELPTWQYYGYLGLYNVAYMMDDVVMLGIATVTLQHGRLQGRGARGLKLLSGLVMLALALLLLWRPDWLARLG